MTTSCTIIKEGRSDEYGRPFTIGQTYIGSLDAVKELWVQGYATPVDVTVFDEAHPLLAGNTVARADHLVEHTAMGTVTAITDPVSGDIEFTASGVILAISEVSAYVNLTATGTAFTGACEFAGYVCTVADGDITIYDALDATVPDTIIVPTTALVVGAFPIFGAGTNGKMALTTGCHVVLSGTATVKVLVQ